MIAQRYELRSPDEKSIGPVLRDENIHYMQMVLPAGERLPVHMTNGNVYMTVLSGTLTLRLADEQPMTVPARTVLKIPKGVEMDAQNGGGDTLELLVVKAPAPQ